MNHSLSESPQRGHSTTRRFASADAAARRLANDEAIEAWVWFMSAPDNP